MNGPTQHMLWIGGILLAVFVALLGLQMAGVIPRG